MWKGSSLQDLEQQTSQKIIPDSILPQDQNQAQSTVVNFKDGAIQGILNTRQRLVEFFSVKRRLYVAIAIFILLVAVVISVVALVLLNRPAVISDPVQIPTDNKEEIETDRDGLWQSLLEAPLLSKAFLGLHSFFVSLSLVSSYGESLE